MKQTIKNILFAAAVTSAVYFCIIFPSEIGYAISLSIERCVNVIIPSMFIFMCLTSAAVRSGIHHYLSLPFVPTAKYIFRMKTEHFGIFLLSMFSGYPAGIKLLTDCFRRNEISEKDFDRLSCFCFAGGPAFISGTVSGVLFPDTPAGTICFISVTAGNIAAALASGFLSAVPKKNASHIKTDIGAQCIIDSTLSSAHAIFQMCAMIIVFGGIYKIAELSGLTYLISDFFSKITGFDIECTDAIISSVFEISNIVNMPPNSIGMLPVISALLSFGGICVLIQATAVSGGLLNIKKFLLSRIFSAAVSALVCRLISEHFNFGAVAVSSFKPVHKKENLLPAILLFIMTVMLLSLSKSYRQNCTKHS